MLNRNEERLGVLIQTYIRAQRQDSGAGDRQERLVSSLDDELRDRLDALGVDSDRLLGVPPADVLNQLAVLEQEAALEDARVTAAAGRARAQEEMDIHGKTPAPRRGPRMCAGKHREPAGRGRRRQRRQR